MSKKSGTVYMYQDTRLQDNPSVLLKKEDDPRRGLDELVKKSRYVIFEVRAVFPFDLFPNSVTICFDKVIFNYKGFGTYDEFPILIENITGARVTRTFFFSSLSIETFGFKANPEPIKYLKHKDARLARRYILALIECKKAGINIESYDIDEVREKLKEVGMVRDFGTDKREIVRHRL